ncbi:hypothetical protein [Parendozoicomonas callyspongiae]|nr:hypothetical protein [Sansalvadorimonas sp. 2012CJ34-2]
MEEITIQVNAAELEEKQFYQFPFSIDRLLNVLSWKLRNLSAL